MAQTFRGRYFSERAENIFLLWAAEFPEACILITVYLYFESQVIDVDVLQMLEEIEKKSEVGDILNYRSTAERELQVCLSLKELVIIAKIVLHS